MFYALSKPVVERAIAELILQRETILRKGASIELIDSY